MRQQIHIDSIADGGGGGGGGDCRVRKMVGYLRRNI